MNDFKKRDEDEIEHVLQEWFLGAHRVVIAGIENPLRKTFWQNQQQYT